MIADTEKCTIHGAEEREVHNHGQASHHHAHDHEQSGHVHRHGTHCSHAGHEHADAAALFAASEKVVQAPVVVSSGAVLTVRPVSGLSGDMILAGLICMTGVDAARLDELSASIGLPALAGCIRLEERSVHGIAGWGCHIELPHEHAHRTLSDVITLIHGCGMSTVAQELAEHAFTILAEAEARVHGIAVDQVHFHEVGALDSILDICLACALYDLIQPAAFVCGPLPMGEGGVCCAHGWIPTPAPAVLEMLEGMPVCGFMGRGETVTPTAVALLRAFGTVFGPWPSMMVERRALVYGDRIFDDAPNGAVWALGRAF